uniref:Variable lymphocyte receptor B cassette n=1 Tax=Petromyzon marinus TaxID=7757 RepID=S4RHQ4_PETMA
TWVFDRLVNLQTLVLICDSWSVMNAGVFDSLTPLTYLGLGGNQLAALPENVFD